MQVYYKFIGFWKQQKKNRDIDMPLDLRFLRDINQLHEMHNKIPLSQERKNV